MDTVSDSSAPDRDSSSTATKELTALQLALDELRKRDACGFDPVRFGYLQALVSRAGQQRPAVRKRLAARAGKALEEYREALQHAKNRAQEYLHACEKEFPQSHGRLQALFEAGDYRAVQRLGYQLSHSHRRDRQQLSALSELTQKLERKEACDDWQSTGPAFDEFLQQQEKQFLQTMTDAESTAGAPSTAPPSQLPELRASKRLRQARKQQHAPQLVNRAIATAPEDPGPLNPQMLAIKALTHMRDLSPQYLNRFVSYLDTLLWLEQNNRPAATDKSGKKGNKRRRKK